MEYMNKCLHVLDYWQTTGQAVPSLALDEGKEDEESAEAGPQGNRRGWGISWGWSSRWEEDEKSAATFPDPPNHEEKSF